MHRDQPKPWRTWAAALPHCCLPPCSQPTSGRCACLNTIDERCVCLPFLVVVVMVVVVVVCPLPPPPPGPGGRPAQPCEPSPGPRIVTQWRGLGCTLLFFTPHPRQSSVTPLAACARGGCGRGRGRWGWWGRLCRRQQGDGRSLSRAGHCVSTRHRQHWCRRGFVAHSRG